MWIPGIYGMQYRSHSPNKLDCAGQAIKAANGYRGGGRFWFMIKCIWQIHTMSSEKVYSKETCLNLHKLTFLKCVRPTSIPLLMEYLSKDHGKLTFSKTQLAKCTIMAVPTILNHHQVSSFKKDRKVHYAFYKNPQTFKFGLLKVGKYIWNCSFPKI